MSKDKLILKDSTEIELETGASLSGRRVQVPSSAVSYKLYFYWQ